jgi:hypothetical protein
MLAGHCPVAHLQLVGDVKARETRRAPTQGSMMSDSAVLLATSDRAGGASQGAGVLSHGEQRSQISDGHRLVEIVRRSGQVLYGDSDFANRALCLPASYWLEKFVPALRARMNRTVTTRINAAIARARRHSAAYGVTTPSVAEYVTEALFDNSWFKSRDNHLRQSVRDRVARTLASRNPIELIFPIFSRKPFSPVKNRGCLPDIAEITSVARLAEAGQMINMLSPTGCSIRVLADGRKYNRACGTPDAVVGDYQSALLCWAKALDAQSIVELIDYESWVGRWLSDRELASRNADYIRRCGELLVSYGSGFDPDSAFESIRRIEAADSVGEQLAFTYRSIVSSVNYKSLWPDWKHGGEPPHLRDDIRRLYVDHIANLHRPIDFFGARREYTASFGYLAPKDVMALFRDLRLEAWQAAVRYVSISLTDRHMNMPLRERPHAIKLTIHAKPHELHFVTASHRDSSMTAQHSTGGLSIEGGRMKIDFRYRIERERDRQTPILVTADRDWPSRAPEFWPLAALRRQRQPIGYVNDPEAFVSGNLDEMLARPAAS